MTAETALGSHVDQVGPEAMEQQHSLLGAQMKQLKQLKQLKLALAPDASDAEADSPWKLDRRDSGSLFWRRDSAACKSARVRFRCDVDVREYQPEYRHDQDADDEEADIYSDDYILKHDMDGGWLQPALRPRALFGYRGLPGLSMPLPQREPLGEPSSLVMSVVCLMAILVTAWLQGSITPISL